MLLYFYLSGILHAWLALVMYWYLWEQSLTNWCVTRVKIIFPDAKNANSDALKANKYPKYQGSHKVYRPASNKQR